jgi:hypothetical protein
VCSLSGIKSVFAKLRKIDSCKGEAVCFLSGIKSVFAKLRKATISFILSACPSIWNNSDPTGRIFIEFYI